MNLFFSITYIYHSHKKDRSGKVKKIFLTRQQNFPPAYQKRNNDLPSQDNHRLEMNINNYVSHPPPPSLQSLIKPTYFVIFVLESMWITKSIGCIELKL